MNTYAYIIAIEEYRLSNEQTFGIRKVRYARNDANAFKKTIEFYLGVKPENVKIFLDKSANRDFFENELKYELSQLGDDDRLILYYAGHGFYQNSTNKLTCWDSDLRNLDGTTVSLQNVVFDALEKSKCKQSLIFLDCCSNYITEGNIGRDLVSIIQQDEFIVNSSNGIYSAVFMSCSPGEKSYTDDNLQHGIWTYHLIEALKGNLKQAIVDEKYITDTSLRRCLSAVVPKFIKEKTFIDSSQQPFAKINSSNDFIISEVIKHKIEISEEPSTGNKVLVNFQGDQPSNIGSSQLFTDAEHLNSWINAIHESQLLISIKIEGNKLHFTNQSGERCFAFIQNVADDYSNL